MEGTNVTQYRDTDASHNHTFYGNGCPNEWDNSVGPPSWGGSSEACSTRLVQINDGEIQENGTYYNFQGLILGNGGSTDNLNSPDTFCPLGWQAPYGGTGGDYYDKSKSWKFLISTYDYGHDNPNQDSIVKYPISATYAGYYHWDNGYLYGQGVVGNYMTPTINTITNYYLVELYSPDHFGTVSYKKLYGSTVRCVLGISTLESKYKMENRILMSE